MTAWLQRLSTKQKLLLGGGIYLLIAIILFAAAGSAGRNDEFKPQDEFKLDPWISIKIGGLDLSINRAVLYLFLGAGLTVWAVTWIARRMQRRPSKVQTAMEAAYGLMRNNITEGNMDHRMAVKWFTFVGTLFMFIWFSNLLGYIPLPTGNEDLNIGGVSIPAFAIYAATANISVTLVLTLFVWFTYYIEGIRAQGVRGYFASWLPAGTPGGAMKGLIFAIEVISHFVRIISLSVRLFANLLAGHLLILFMGGGMVVLLGVAALGAITLPVAIVFFVFEVVLIATLQAFIFATLTAIYLGGAVEGGH
jgi:F-type H+-transporting ATPase subunit a